jgi:hypothetical protein
MLRRTRANLSFLVVEVQRGPSIRYFDNIFGNPLKRRFAASVDLHDIDAYDKSFKSRDHPTMLIFAKVSRLDNLQGLGVALDANAHHRYRLGAGELARSTLSDVNMP